MDLRRSVGEVGNGEWERDADNWVRWSRTPGHDAYWYYRDQFFDSILPAPGRLTLEIGCGEGRVARDLEARGYRVTAVDTARSLIEQAQRTSSASRFSVADGAALPFSARCFDLVVAYNALQVVADMGGTVEEAARVLVRGGYFCICVAHPVTDLGTFVNDNHDMRYTMRMGYFETTRVDETVERDGLVMTFRGWTHTLEDYALALAEAGFAIEVIREPRPDPSADRYARWKQVPMFMNLRAIKR